MRKLAQELGTDILIGRSGLSDTVVKNPADSSSPAHSKLILQTQRLDQTLASEHWVIAESWWAESFNPPRFKNLARWGTQVIPWTIASHFGTRVRQAMALPPAPDSAGIFARIFRNVTRLVRIVAAVLSFILGMMISPVLMLVFALLLFVSLVPIKAVREVLQNLQMRLASTMGDSYILLSHPVYAASIIGKVRRDIEWLAKRCDAVVVVAHSQGGAVAHLAAQHGINKKQKLLFTFGSGLKKLELLNYILSTGHSFRVSAFLNLIFLPVFAFSAFWFAIFIIRSFTAGNEAFIAEMTSVIPVMLGYLVVSALVVYATSRDFIRGVTPPALADWIKKLKASALKWIDSFATADPVSNGPLMKDDELDGISIEVCNLNSVGKDHTTYWQNRDQFISLLMQQLGGKDFRAENAMRPQKELTLPDLELISDRRRWRVGMLRVISWVGWLSLLIVTVRNSRQVWHFAGYWYDKLFAWLPFAHSEQAVEYAIAWPTVGYFSVILVPYGAARYFWRRWNESEMRGIIRGDTAVSGGHIIALVMLIFQLLAILVFILDMPSWAFAIALIVMFIGVIVSEPDLTEPQFLQAKEIQGNSSEAVSEGEKILYALAKLGGAFTPPFALGIVSWEAVLWIWSRFLPEVLLFGKCDPQNISSPLVGFIVAMIAVPFVWRTLVQKPGEQEQESSAADAASRGDS